MGVGGERWEQTETEIGSFRLSMKRYRINLRGAFVTLRWHFRLDLMRVGGFFLLPSSNNAVSKLLSLREAKLKKGIRLKRARCGLITLRGGNFSLLLGVVGFHDIAV